MAVTSKPSWMTWHPYSTAMCTARAIPAAVSWCGAVPSSMSSSTAGKLNMVQPWQRPRTSGPRPTRIDATNVA